MLQRLPHCAPGTHEQGLERFDADTEDVGRLMVGESKVVDEGQGGALSRGQRLQALPDMGRDIEAAVDPRLGARRIDGLAG